MLSFHYLDQTFSGLANLIPPCPLRIDVNDTVHRMADSPKYFVGDETTTLTLSVVSRRRGRLLPLGTLRR